MVKGSEDKRQELQQATPSCIAMAHPSQLYEGYTGFVLPLVTNSRKWISHAGSVAKSGNAVLAQA